MVGITSDIGGPAFEQPPIGATLLEGGPEGGQAPLARYWQTVLRWRWVVLGTFVAALLLGVIATLSTTPIYRAAITLEILREEAKIVDVKSVEPVNGVFDQEFYQTQYGLLKSRALAERIVRKLGLARDDRFVELYGRSFANGGIFGSASGDASAAGVAAKRERAAIRVVLNNIAISPVRASRLVDVAFSSPDRLLSERVANAWADNFIASNLERRFEASAYARRFLEERLREVRDRLEASERSAVDYATRQRIINVAGAVGSDGRSAEQALISNDLATLNQALNVAITDRVAAESRLGRSAGSASPELLSNVVLSGLRRQSAEASAEASRLSAQFKPDYPPIVALRSQLGEIDRLTRREEQRIVDAARSQYDSAKQREDLLSARVAALKGGYLDNRRRSIQYNIFQRDVDTNRTLYDGLLQRYKEIGIAGGVGTNNISIVDRRSRGCAGKSFFPAPAGEPCDRRAARVAARTGRGIRARTGRRDDLEPRGNQREIGRRFARGYPHGNRNRPAYCAGRPAIGHFRVLFLVNTALQFSTTHGFPKSLVITSSRPNEGKSTTSISIARNLARLNRTVLLIDGDLRKPSLHQTLGLHNRVGFSTALVGNDAIADLIQDVDVAGLSVMTAGPLPPNPAELLSGDRLQRLLELIGVKFEHIVIDGPPVLGLADAPLLGSHVKNIVFLAEAHKARLNVVRFALRRLVAARAHVLGVVLTKFEPRRSCVGYGDDYGYAYVYRYGTTPTAEVDAADGLAVAPHRKT